jgi:hypothetical protein
MTPDIVFAFALGFACGTTMTRLVRAIASLTSASRKADEDWRSMRRREW